MIKVIVDTTENPFDTNLVYIEGQTPIDEDEKQTWIPYGWSC